MQNNTETKYWKGLNELSNDAEFQTSQNKEFAEDLPIDDFFGKVTEQSKSHRRDFLKALGFGVSAVAVAACNEAPVRKAIPYLVKPEEITPGVANYYASTCGGCTTGCSIVVRTREGRPIKVEGNDLSSLNQGGVCGVGHASVLSLYDSSKLKNPMLNGSSSTWADLDAFVIKNLEASAAAGKKITILTGTITSPSAKKAVGKLASKYSTVEHVTYDAVSASGILMANKTSFNKQVVPNYKFQDAKVVVSFGADFLGTWISPVEYTKNFMKNRKLHNGEKEMSRHIQFETGMSITGSNADVRIPVKPSQEGLAVVSLYNNIAKIAGAAQYGAEPIEFAGNILANTAQELWDNKGKSLVISGSNDVSVQLMVNAINSLLGNYGSTIDLDNPSFQKQGVDGDMSKLVKSMANGEVGTLIMFNVNPAYDYADAAAFKDAIAKVDFSLTFDNKVSETASLVTAIAPAHSFLESWDDNQAKAGLFSITQPTIAPIFNSRQWQESILVWAGEKMSYYKFIQENWKNEGFKKQSKFIVFQEFWDNAVRDGVVNMEPKASSSYSYSADLAGDVQQITKASKGLSGVAELKIYEKVGLKDGKQANNPWLQELPDPISKATWDNYIAISPKFAEEKGIKEEDVVEITTEKGSFKLPVLMQPGQAYGTVSVAIGYGREGEGKCADGVGVNVFQHNMASQGNWYGAIAVTNMTVTGEEYVLAQTQTHHSYEGRNIVQETTLENFLKDPHAGAESHAMDDTYSLWPDRDKRGHHWAMAIDLNACTGCGSCVVSCQAENNVAVVGRDEVRRRREMHWIRIDRYYSGDPESPEVVHQPMLCQHCDHAPCESVCPVLATMHSSEGLNQQVYNRCVGTRYCANNCPFKVRRFNWFNYTDNNKFDYNLNDDLGKMALNPDVVVRSRGVMEKCSFCVQRIQSSKLEAKMAGEPMKDGAVKTACQQSCPADAIVFGDVNDPDSEVNKLLHSGRNYFILEELNVQPGIGYQRQVRNKKSEA